MFFSSIPFLPVIANTLMMKEASNIFFPQFVLKERPRLLQQTIDSWCDGQRTGDISIESAKQLAIDLEVRSVQ